MATLIAPRYSAEDFETGSIRSVAPSYISEAPSYHSRQSTEAAPPSYTPRERTRARRQQQPVQEQTIGLPPIPPVQASGVPSLHNFNIPTWSPRNAVSSRQLHSVIERRANAEAANSSNNNNRPTTPRRGSSLPIREEEPTVRPLEDPYLVGEEAAASAKRDRLASERDVNILQQMEDKQWDWLLTQMRTWDERERSWSRFRREVDNPQRKNLLRRMGGRLI